MQPARIPVFLALAVVFAWPAIAQDREPISESAEPVTPYQVDGFDLGDPTEKIEATRSPTCGNPRKVEFEATAVPQGGLDEIQALGRISMLDPQTGQMLFEHLTDYLPIGWGKIVASGQRTDSLGRPIVNEVDGLPAWSEPDVSTLRAAITEATARVRSPVGSSKEAQWYLGNLIGQALVRQLDISDLLDLNDSSIVTTGVAEAILEQLHFYENLKVSRADSWGYGYRVSSYEPAIVQFIDNRGSSLAEVLARDRIESMSPETTPSGCYSKTEFAKGMTILTGATVIWETSGTIDASADVPTGFLFYFYGCDVPNPNLNVRVSTKGYFSFFEQGGGAEDGTDWTNDPITSTIDPDGFVAPYWDDLWVAPAQGSPDKVSYLIEGAIGERVFTVEWFSVSRYGGGGSDFHYFQAKLLEASGDVELHFTSGWALDPLDDATVGQEDFAGVDGDCGPNCDATNTGDTIANNYRFAPNRPLYDSCSMFFAGCLAADQTFQSGTNLGATGTDVTTCGYNDIHDVWFWYHSPLSANVAFDTCAGSNFDTTLAVFDDCAGAQVACNDDSCGLQSSLTASLAAEQDYFVRLGGYSGLQGDYTITATPTSVPSGDTCSDAWSIGTTFNGFTRNNSGCVDQSSCGFRDSIDEWFSWTAPATGTATFTTCTVPTDFDTTLAVFDACGGSELACNDDSAGLCSTIDLDVEDGEDYYVRLAGYNRSYGNYQLRVIVDTDTYYEDGFESGLGDWTPDGLWNLEHEVEACGGTVGPYPEPSGYAAYYGQDGGVCNYDTGAANSGSLTLNTPVMLPADQPAFLSFWSYEETECVEVCPYDRRFVEISTDGGSSWQQVGDRLSLEGQWYRNIISLSDFAGMNVLVRFSFDSIDALGNTYFGWMVDEVRIGRSGLRDRFEGTMGNWTLSGLWNGENEGDTCGAPLAPFPDPLNAMYYGQDGICNYDTGAANSGQLTYNYPIMLPPDAPMALSFWSYEETECGGNCAYDNRSVLISDDFQATWMSLGQVGNENEWYRPAFGVGAYADQAISLQFEFDTTDSISNNYFGWLVDGVELGSARIFASGFESGNYSGWSGYVP